MENMKMSDVFDLPLQRAVNELAIIDKDDCVVGWADAFSGEAARDCIVESVNNYDRLIEENKQQRESLDAFRELVKAQTKTMSELNEENKHLKSDRDSAISLMSKSWQHNAEDYPTLLTGFVKMANRQFELLSKKKEENAELRAALFGLMDCNGILTSDKECVIRAKQILNKK